MPKSTDTASPSLRWIAVVIAALALVPVLAMTFAVAAVAWMPLVAALAVVAVVLLVKSRTRRV